MEPAPARFNIARHCLAANARLRPQKTALVLAGAGGREERLSFAEVDEAVRRLAGGLLSLGLPAGARILIRLGNESDYAIAYFACVAAGLVALPSSIQLTLPEVEFLLQDSGAAAMIVGDDIAPAGTGLLRVGRDDLQRLKRSKAVSTYADTTSEQPAYLIYTSGTSGRPKGVLHAHRSVWGRRPMHQDWLGLGPDDVVVHSGALNWTYTLGVGLLDPWANGATAVLYNGPRDPQIWPHLWQRHGATIVAAVPTLYRQILKYSDPGRCDLGTLRHGVTAGEALPPPLLEAWQQATGRPLYEALGMSEISTYVSSGPPVPVRPGSPGKPQRGRRIAVLPAIGEAALGPGETGFLAVHRSDPGLMLGYWQRPEEDRLVQRGEWFVGGDLAAIDEDGYVWYHGRGDEVMNPMGYRVSPIEVEAAIARHPDVAEVAVAELRVRSDVSVVAAFVVLRPAASVTAEQVLDFAAQGLAAYKCPREVIFCDRLPRTGNGKIRRRDLASLAGRELL